MSESSELSLRGSYQVVIANEVIKGRSPLTLNETKLLRTAISQVVKEDQDLQTYTVKLNDLAEFFKIDSSDLYRDIKPMCAHIMQSVIEIGDDPKHWEYIHWTDKCRYDDGVITIKLSDELKPYLINLSQLYTQYFLEDIIFLKSTHAIRLYELIIEETRTKVYANKTADVFISVENIRRATNTEKKYPDNSMFRKRVIEKSIDEIEKKKLAYKISFETVKEKGRVTGYLFHVSSRMGYNPDREE
ncbi:MAG: replication initiation protein [Clostridia bacterium]|nr:replication initiation protein [Clostridia bacterium]